MTRHISYYRKTLPAWPILILLFDLLVERCINLGKSGNISKDYYTENLEHCSQPMLAHALLYIPFFADGNQHQPRMEPFNFKTTPEKPGCLEL